MNFREEVLKKVNPSLEDRLLYGVIGLAGEAGETLDLVKKFRFHGKPFDKEKLINELGDVAWHIELICSELGVSLEYVQAANVAKLNKRYPDGFTQKDSAERRDTIKAVVDQAEKELNGN